MSSEYSEKSTGGFLSTGNQAILWMVLGGFAFSTMAALTHDLGDECDWLLIVFVRMLISFIIAFGLAKRAGLNPILLGKPLLWVRSLVGSSAMLATFYAIINLPISDVAVITETRPIWTNAEDEVYSELTGRYHTSNHATIWRWRKAYQHDFAARIDWSNTSIYENANHPPNVKLDHPNEINAITGAPVTLSGKGSTDPDGDELNYRWIYYDEVGSLNVDSRGFKIKNHDQQTATFIAPPTELAKTMHIILEVTDTGLPSLTRYQRVIVNVMPDDK